MLMHLVMNLNKIARNHIQGCVSSINEELFTFCLDNSVTINAAYISFHKSDFHLPRLDEHVSIIDFHCAESGIIYLCGESEIKITGPELKVESSLFKNTTEEEEGNEDDFLIWELVRKFSNKNKDDCLILNLIREYSLGVPDIIQIYLTFIQFGASFQRKWGLSSEILALQVVPILIGIPETTDHSCKNRILPNCRLLPVSKLKFVNQETDKYNEFPYWSFGVHPHLKGRDFMIGYLYVHEKYGIPVIRDAHSQMVCMIITKSHHSLRKYFFSYILVKKFTVITEIYKDAKTLNLEYLMIHIDDVQVIENYGKETLCSRTDTVVNTNDKQLAFYLENKSVPKISTQNKLEYWLEIEIITSNCNLHGKVFLKLNSNLMNELPFLECGSVYKLYYSGNLKRDCNSELKRFYPVCQQYELVDQKVVFELQVEHNREKFRLMNAAECKAFIATEPSGMISFEGKVKSKRFADPISSRTRRKVPFYGFGTSGVKTHYIEFAVEGSDVKTLNLYFNNWESSLIPFGFIPEMKLSVRNVVHQKGKYLKSTPLTSFEILGYQPAVSFRTTNLFSFCEGDWGEPFFFGLGSKIPYGVLITGEVTRVSVNSLNIKSICVACKTVMQGKECPCDNNTKSEYKLDVTMTMYVADLFGEAKIISKSEELLRAILNLQSRQFALWREAFQEVGSYEYCNYKSEGPFTMDKKDLFCKMLTRAIKTVNAVGIIELHMCCRKLDTKPGSDPFTPLWFCLKARKK